MDRPLKLLVIEDNPADFRLVERHLQQHGLAVHCQRVATLEELKAALGEGGWDAVLSDYSVPKLDFQDILGVLQARQPDLPLILVSGSVGEEQAVELLKLGVWDFVLKNNLARLTPALERSLRDASGRRARQLAETNLRESRLAALNMMEDAVEARHEAERISAELRQEVAERRRAEDALRLFRTLVDRSSDAIEVVDPVTARFLDVNEKGCAELGYRREELLALTVPEIDPGVGPAEFKAHVAALRESGLAVFESLHRRKDGSTFPVEVNLRYVELDRHYIISVVRDITERKRLEAGRAAIAAQMQQQQRLESIGTLASGVAHEINNPINGIMNYAQLIQDRLEPGSSLTEYTGEILHETQRVATIVRNLLTFARNERQSHSPARVADIVEGTLSLIRTVIRHDQITLTVKVPAGLPELKCRSQQIQQVLMNLMTNARDALNERYPGHDPDKVLNLEARLFEADGRRWIRVTVEDHGTGIAAEVRERMFDPFFTTKPRDQGTGLGLAISHGIVKEHRGTLTVESEPGCFTRMHLDLPVDDGRQAGDHQPAPH